MASIKGLMKQRDPLKRVRSTGDIGEILDGVQTNNDFEDEVMDPFKIAQEIQKSRYEYQKSIRQKNSQSEIPSALSKE